MTHRPAVFLDRDGTLIEDRGHLGDPVQALLFPDTISALKRLRDQFELFIVTNQSGIAKGVISPESVAKVNQHIVDLLAQEGIAIREVYCCPHQRSDGCDCIKPNPHFALRARQVHGIDLQRSFVIGDHPTDVAFAANMGARGVYVLSGHGAKHREELEHPCSVVAGIAEAVDEIQVARAVDVLRSGRLVAFPTETVYGLGAVADNEAAVRRIFEAKGRPIQHPLIVHAADPWEWTEPPSADARLLADRFWPGPMTLILKKSERTPLAVTGGQDTVGVRIPSHPFALAMLKRLGGGVAAPSANRFGRVSPTTARHVRDELGDRVDFILDGGACEVGLESTIVDVSGSTPTILRPGGVPCEEIEEALGRPVAIPESSDVRAPGRIKSHYAPRAQVIVLSPEGVEEHAAELRRRGLNVETLLNPEAHGLYAALREADERNADVIVVGAPVEAGLGRAVADRLRKASAAASPATCDAVVRIPEPPPLRPRRIA